MFLTETCLGDGAALQGLKIELVVWGKGQGQTALISIVPETLLVCLQHPIHCCLAEWMYLKNLKTGEKSFSRDFQGCLGKWEMFLENPRSLPFLLHVTEVFIKSFQSHCGGSAVAQCWRMRGVKLGILIWALFLLFQVFVWVSSQQPQVYSNINESPSCCRVWEGTASVSNSFKPSILCLSHSPRVGVRTWVHVWICSVWWNFCKGETRFFSCNELAVSIAVYIVHMCLSLSARPFVLVLLSRI